MVLARILNDNGNAKAPLYQKEDDTEGPLVIDLNAMVPPKEEADTPERRCMLDIGDNHFVVAGTYNGQLSIHIRQFEKSAAGKLFPTKKGVTFPLNRWLNLESIEETLADSLKAHDKVDSELTWHLGGGVNATISPLYPTIDIRHFWKPQFEDKPIPTRKGIVLTRKRFEKLQGVIQIIRDFVPELDRTVPCMMNDDHQNQEGMLNCPECTPFGYDEPDFKGPFYSEHEPAWSYDF